MRSSRENIRRFLVNFFALNLQRLELQHSGETATWVVLEHQESHRIVCMAISLLLACAERVPLAPKSSFHILTASNWSKSRRIDEAPGCWGERPTIHLKSSRATLNFQKFKVALNPTNRIFLNFAKSCILSCLSKVDNMKKISLRSLWIVSP